VKDSFGVEVPDPLDMLTGDMLAARKDNMQRECNAKVRSRYMKRVTGIE
jgi:hypothetical protein